MSALSGHVADYLRLRRVLGFKLEHAGRMLPQFVAFLDAAGEQTITGVSAIAWAQLPDAQPIVWAHRLAAVRGLARYLATIDPGTEIPPVGVFAVRYRRPVPYVYSMAEVSGLLRATRTLCPPMRAATHEALFGLLATSGMRDGEAIGLERSDVDLQDGIVTIRNGKFARARLLPLHPSATDALRAYAARRDRLRPAPKSDRYFLSSAGTALTYPACRRRSSRSAPRPGCARTPAGPGFTI